MLTFKQFLNEVVNIKFVNYFSGPFISDARNVNVARKELLGSRASSKATEDENDFRALYDPKSNKIWIWYSIDGLHMAVAKILKLDKPLHIVYYSKSKYATAPASAMLVINDLDDDDKQNIIKWFGKRTKFGGPLDVIEKAK